MFTFIAKRFRVLPRRDLSVFKHPSLVKLISTDSKAHNSFVTSYLINTCGVPQEKATAISAAKRVQFECAEKPDLVIAFFRDNGFTKTHISKITGKLPYLLLCRVESTLKPKFDFFKSEGISGNDLASILCQDPSLLMTSLENKIIPFFGIIRSLLQTDAKIIAILKRSPRVLIQDPQINLVPNVAHLQAQGVPADNIAKLLVSQPMAFLKPTSRFREIVEEVKRMEFDPSQYLFLLAIHGLTCMTRSSLEAKFDIYRRWGLSEDELLFMFRKNPYCLMISEKNIVSTMNYFVTEMGYTPSVIVRQPDVLLFSLKKRIVPRWSVIQELKAKGLGGNERSLDALLKLPEEVFLKKYVVEFEKEVPELLSIYRRRDE